jgi:predicted regulator of Ras-like GTPase activity (Roadblock/LC7/MglB family)
MKLLPRSVTVSGLLVALAALLVSADMLPVLTTLIGAENATRLAALGTVIAALGRALIPPAVAPTTPDGA